jgi:hypothetical protein
MVYQQEHTLLYDIEWDTSVMPAFEAVELE